MYLCLSLGFQGRYRLSPRGPGELDRLREDLYTIIARQRQAADPALSPHWQGVRAPYRPARAMVPTWVMGASALAVIGGLFVWFSTGLNAASDEVFARLLGAPLAHMPRIARAAPVTRRRRRRRAPQSPIRSTSSSSRRSTRGWSPCWATARCRSCASATPACSPPAARPWQRSYYPLLERIGEALKAEKGPVTVDRLHRQPADPHGAVPVQLPALHGARRGGAGDHRARARRARPRRGAGPRGRRSDRVQRHAGRPRPEPAHRGGAAEAGLDHACRPALSRLPLVPDLRRRRAARRSGLAVRSVPVVPGRLAAPRHRHRGDGADLGRGELLARSPAPQERGRAASRASPQVRPIPRPPPRPRKSRRCARS